MESCARARRWPEVVSIFELLQVHRCHDTVSLNVCVRSLARAGLWEEALARIQHGDVVSYTAVACDCDWSAAVAILESLPHLAIQTDEILHGTVVTALAKARRWQDALERKVFGSLGRNAVLHACATQWRRVMSQLRGLEGRGADQASYHIAMGSLGARLSWRSCVACMSRMDVMQLSRNIITFNEAMNVCNSADQWEISLLQATSLLSRAARLQPDTATPSLVLSSKPWTKAGRILEEIIEASWQVDAIACNVALTSCTDGWQQHLALLRFQERSAASIASFSTAMKACGASAWSISLALLKEATAQRLRGDATAVNVLVTALGRGSQWRLALSFLLDVKADVMAYNAMMSALDEASQWRLVSTLFSRMLSSQLLAIAWPYEPNIK